MNLNRFKSSVDRCSVPLTRALLALAAITCQARSETVSLAWNPNSESDLAGYKLYRGSSSGQYDWVRDVGMSTSIQVEDLKPNQTYFFTVTAYNTANLESDPSNVVAYTVPDSPDVEPA